MIDNNNWYVAQGNGVIDRVNEEAAARIIMPGWLLRIPFEMVLRQTKGKSNVRMNYCRAALSIGAVIDSAIKYALTQFTRTWRPSSTLLSDIV